jgi:hypothetical protein
MCNTYVTVIFNLILTTTSVTSQFSNLSQFTDLLITNFKYQYQKGLCINNGMYIHLRNPYVVIFLPENGCKQQKGLGD